MAKTKQYDDTFKRSAVRLSYEYGNIMKAARELNVPYTMLYNWRKEYSFVRLNLSNESKPEQERKTTKKTFNFLTFRG